MWRIKKIFSIFTIFILILTGFLEMGFAEEIETFNDSAEQYGEGYRYNTQGWIYVHIQGDPYERGFQHGYLLSDEIVDMINRWSNTIHKQETINKISLRISEKKYKDISETWWNFCRRQCDDDEEPAPNKFQAGCTIPAGTDLPKQICCMPKADVKPVPEFSTIGLAAALAAVVCI